MQYLSFSDLLTAHRYHRFVGTRRMAREGEEAARVAAAAYHGTETDV